MKNIEKEIDDFLDGIGKSGSKVMSPLEKKDEKLQDNLKDLRKRKGELTMPVANSPSKVDP